MRADALKRTFDVATAAVALTLSLPIQIVVAATIAARLGRPVLFRQVRPGLAGQPFTLIKFRTMSAPDPERGIVTDAERLTPLGRFLRASSLDELPTLINVLRGEMSVVGPRPLLMEYLPLYTPEQSRRHDVRPGLTGLAQVSGRNSLSWADRLALDVDYVQHRSFALDLTIILRTFAQLARVGQVSQAGHVTMSPFTGSSSR
ncbi:sugar transferase [Microlunatus ginsengisoli]|uniref:Sugar transferase n=1 Tax=Microlunatus ginsengisoli TaxID=363863 RepID=A0ABP6ZFX0_9ACTN